MESLFVKEYVDDWLKIVLVDDQVIYKSYTMPLKVLPFEARVAVWTVAMRLDINENGVPGTACRILEYYLYKRMMGFTDGPDGVQGLLNIQSDLEQKTPLLIAVCLQLTAKMFSTRINVTPTKIRAVLSEGNCHYTLNEINKWEYEIFQAMDYQVPLWTGVDAALLLAVEVGLSPQAIAALIHVVDLSEYRFDIIIKQVMAVANLLPEEYRDVTTLRTVHFMAACVAASYNLFETVARNDPVIHLAALTRTSCNYIRYIRDIIRTLVIVTDEFYKNKQSEREMSNESPNSQEAPDTEEMPEEPHQPPSKNAFE